MDFYSEFPAKMPPFLVEQDILINYYQQCVDLIIKKVGSWQTIHGYKIVVDISFEFASAINALE